VHLLNIECISVFMPAPSTRPCYVPSTHWPLSNNLPPLQTHCAKVKRASSKYLEYFCFYARGINSTMLCAVNAKHLNKIIWKEITGNKITQLIKSRTGQWSFMHNNLTVCIMAAYYNPRCHDRIKDGVLVHRERGTTGGAQIDIDCKTAAYTSSMQIFALDHLPLYDRKYQK
jgi:hypothetical protein